MLRYITLWITLGWVMVLTVCYLSLIAVPPDFDIDFKYIDKLEHFVSYFILMGWFAQIYKTKQGRIYYALFFSLMGISLEILQGLGQVRFFEVSDMLANMSGVVAAWIITKGHFKHVLLSFENRILN